MQKQWRWIKNYINLYQVSNYGQIRRVKGYKCRQKRTLKPRHSNRGYLYVNLWKNNRYKTHMIHTLVLEAFFGCRPKNMQCRHVDGNKNNNKFINLKWGTNSENQMDRILHGTSNRGAQSSSAKLTNNDVILIKNLLVLKIKQSKIAKQFHVHPHTISDIATSKTWRHLI